MSVLHEEFARWLIEGARDEPARDVAIHASACPSCLLLAGANDALTLIDPSAAPLPSTPPVGDWADRPSWPLRVAGSAAAVMLAAIVGIAAGGTLIRQPSAAPVGDASQTPREAVLAGTGSPTPALIDTPGQDASAAPDASPTPTAPPSTLPPAPPGLPPIGPPPPVVGPTPPAPTPTPTPTPTPSPTATPSASPSLPISGTPSPSPTPTLQPSPTLSPSPSCDVGCEP